VTLLGYEVESIHATPCLLTDQRQHFRLANNSANRFQKTFAAILSRIVTQIHLGVFPLQLQHRHRCRQQTVHTKTVPIIITNLFQQFFELALQVMTLKIFGR